MPVSKPAAGATTRGVEFRKIGPDLYEVYQQTRRRFRNKGEALRFRKLLRAGAAEAARRLADRMDAAGDCCSIRDRLEEFLSDSRAGLGRRPCGWKTLERHRRRLLAFNRSFRSAPLAAVGREALERWMKRRLGSVGPDTVNADLVSLRAFARWAQRKRYAPDFLPLMLVERLHAPGKLPGKNRLPPKALEMGAVLRRIGKIGGARADVGRFLLGMALFGLRPVAVAALNREDATLPRGADVGRLHCRGFKNCPARDIPVAPDSAQHRWLAACLAAGKEAGRVGRRAPLVPNRHGQPARSKRPGGWTTEGLDMALRRVCARLKIRDFTAYRIRHSFVSWLQAQGHSLAAVQVYAGHAVITTQTAYAHRHVREAVEAYRMVGEMVEGLPF